jgi:hypothetical protein
MIAAACACAVHWAACLIVWLVEIKPRTQLIREVEDQLGFTTGDAPVDGNPLNEVFAFGWIEPAGIMERGGIRSGDRPLWSTGCLYKRLLDGQGDVVTIPVERDRWRLSIDVRVPKLRLSLDPRQVHWFCAKHTIADHRVRRRLSINAEKRGCDAAPLLKRPSNLRNLRKSADPISAL